MILQKSFEYADLVLKTISYYYRVKLFIQFNKVSEVQKDQQLKRFELKSLYFWD